MFRVSMNVMSAIGQLLKNLNVFFQIVLEKGALSLLLVIKSIFLW